MRVQRVIMPVTATESWTVIGDDGAVVEPVERYLAYLAALERSPNEHLDRAGQPITFSGVAAAASVSRAWLYRQPDIRDLISRLRSSPTRSGTTPASQRATAESLRSRLDATRAEVTRLRAENAMLRDEVARRLGQDRANPGHNIHPLTQP